MSENKKCPFCKDGEAYFDFDERNNAAIFCDNCNAVGPYKKTEAEAWKSWNTRADSDAWISVEDRLPRGRNKWGSCWWMVSRKGMISMNAQFVEGKWLIDGDELSDVTHWQPLLDPPEVSHDHRP